MSLPKTLSDHETDVNALADKGCRSSYNKADGIFGINTKGRGQGIPRTLSRGSGYSALAPKARLLDGTGSDEVLFEQGDAAGKLVGHLLGINAHAGGVAGAESYLAASDARPVCRTRSAEKTRLYLAGLTTPCHSSRGLLVDIPWPHLSTRIPEIP